MYVADICNFYFVPREIRHYAWQAKVPKHDKMKLEHGISYFPLYKPWIIREQCTL